MKTIVVKTQAELDALGAEIDANLEISFNGAICSAVKISGYLYVDGSAKLDAPLLTSVGGYLYVDGSAKLDAPLLTSVGGDLYVDGSAKLDALTSVGGDLGVYGSAKLDAPLLTSVGGYLRVDGSAKLDALTSVGGYLYVDGSAKLDAPLLTSVGGYLYVDGSAKLDAPLLTSVGGYLYVDGSAKLDALTSVGGDLSVYGSAKLDAPLLTSVGGYLRVDGSAKLDAPLAKYNQTAWAVDFSLNLKLSISIKVRESFLANGFLFADGILGKITGSKSLQGNTIYTVLINGGLKTAYCVQKGEQFSHGDTVEEAIKSLRYKLSDRDTTRFKEWNLETEISLDDAIQAYRAITGACEFGVRWFCESTTLPESMTVAEAIKLTDGKYEHSKFREFFNE